MRRRQFFGKVLKVLAAAGAAAAAAEVGSVQPPVPQRWGHRGGGLGFPAGGHLLAETGDYIDAEGGNRLTTG